MLVSECLVLDANHQSAEAQQATFYIAILDLPEGAENM
jgi:hypothetical protein